MKLTNLVRYHPHVKTKHEPLRTYEECAEALGFNMNQLNAARRRANAVFPTAVFTHHQTLSCGKRTYYRLSEVRAWKALVDAEQLAKLASAHNYVRAGLLAELVVEPL